MYLYWLHNLCISSRKYCSSWEGFSIARIRSETVDLMVSLIEATRWIGVPFPGSALFANGPAHEPSGSRI